MEMGQNSSKKYENESNKFFSKMKIEQGNSLLTILK